MDAANYEQRLPIYGMPLTVMRNASHFVAGDRRVCLRGIISNGEKRLAQQQTKNRPPP